VVIFASIHKLAKAQYNAFDKDLEDAALLHTVHAGQAAKSSARVEAELV
jgi:hypothetical protein